MRFLQKNGEIEKEREGETPIFVKKYVEATSMHVPKGVTTPRAT